MGAKLDAIMKDVNKKAKEEIITVGLSEYSYTRIPFTSPEMNYCTFGGIPVGKITELFGEEHGGKTTTALDLISNYQQMPDAKEVFYVDAENTLDVEWARKLCVDVDKLVILQPKLQSAEDIFQILLDAVETGEVGLWVLDSIPALISNAAWDKDMDEKTYAGISSPLTLFASKMIQLMGKTKATGIAINQIRDDLNSRYGGTKTPGGHAWKHFCAVRLEFRRGKFLDEKGNELTRAAETPVGNLVMMDMVKNKTCPPTRRIGKYTLNYETGIDYLSDLIEVAIRYDIIQKSGSWFELINVETGELLCSDKIQGQANVHAYLEDHEDVLLAVEMLVNKAIGELH